MKGTMVVSIVAFAITLVCLLGGFWWWALFGMREQVGTALAVTTISAGLIGFFSRLAEL